MIIFLVGFMGCGKSTSGRQLALELGFQFIDTDESIEERYGKSVAALFLEKGEEWFRGEEEKMIGEFKPETVVATGGGMAAIPGAIEKMNSIGPTIYIRLTPEQLTERLKGDQSLRPLLAGLPEIEMKGFIENRFNEREPFYSRAQFIVNGALSMDEVVRELKSKISHIR